MSVRQIAEGFFNHIANKNKELFESRYSVCKECKIMEDGICRDDVYLNLMTNDLSNVKKSGYFNGCGCILDLKCRVPDAKCPLDKW